MTAYKLVPLLGTVTDGVVYWSGSAWTHDLVAPANLGTALAAILQTGTAAPATGAHARGEIVWNTQPSAGGTPGWMCVSAGTPGTWKAMASLAA